MLTGFYRKFPSMVADSVGFGHFLVANTIFLLGQVTYLFKDLGGFYPGLRFVFQYLDFPLAALPYISDMAQAAEGGSLRFAFVMGDSRGERLREIH